METKKKKNFLKKIFGTKKDSCCQVEFEPVEEETNNGCCSKDNNDSGSCC